MSGLWSDIRFGLRMLVKNPGYAFVAVLTLGLGIGANATVFCIFSSVFLTPIGGVKDADRLVTFDILDSERGKPLPIFSYPDFKDFQQELDVFEGVAAYNHFVAAIGFEDRAEKVQGTLVSHNYFSLIGVQPVLGRYFTPEEDRVGGMHPVAVISQAYWKRRFASDPDILGKVVTIAQHPFTVVGVVPAFKLHGFLFTSDVWVPLTMFQQVEPSKYRQRDGVETSGDLLSDRNRVWLQWIARLNEGASVAQAQAAVSLQARRAVEMYESGSILSFPLTVVPIGEYERTLVREGLPVGVIFLALASLVLLIACANLTNLLLARNTARRQEIAVRAAIGAGRFRLVRQLVTESVLIALSGGGLGLLVALWTETVLTNFIVSVTAKSHFPFRPEIEVGLNVFLYMFLISLATGVLFGLLPAWRSSRLAVCHDLKGEYSSQRSARPFFTLRSSLVVGQVAVSLFLLIVAGLFLKSVRNAHNADLGFKPEGVVSIPLDLDAMHYGEGDGKALLRTLLEKVREIPQIEYASLALHCQGEEKFSNFFCRLDGSDEAGISVFGNYVDTDYFQCMTMPLLSGRGFLERDRTGDAVVVINEALQKRLFQGEESLGGQIRLSYWLGNQSKTVWATVVGVVKDAKYHSVNESSRPYLYLPFSRTPAQFATVLLKTSDAEGVISRLNEMLPAFYPEFPVYELRPLSDRLEIWFLTPRLASLLTGCVGLFGLILAVVGLYGVMAYLVSQRTREIGIRMALGAKPVQILRRVIRQGLGLVMVGETIGIIVAVILTRLIQKLLFGVSAVDLYTFLVTSSSFVVVGVLACLFPARRAAKIDPNAALRCE